MNPQIIIVGGSYAGLSAGLMLGRALKHVLIIDEGVRRNKQAHEAHNYLTRDGQNPNEIARIAREELGKYKTVSILDDKVVTVTQNDNKSFSVLTENNGSYSAQKVILAYGVKDEMLPIPGFKECWGDSIFTCPFCHGYEEAHKKIGVLTLMGSEAVQEMGKLILQWSKNITIFLNGGSLKEEHENIFKKLKIPIVKENVKEIIHQNGRASSIHLENGEKHEIEAIFTRVPAFLNNTQIVSDLGLSLNPFNLIQVDDFGKTNVKGVYAAGDCTTPFAQVSAAAAAGSKIGAFVQKEIMDEEFEQLLLHT